MLVPVPERVEIVVVDHVVGRRHELGEGPGDAFVVAEGAKRGELGHELRLPKRGLDSDGDLGSRCRPGRRGCLRRQDEAPPPHQRRCALSRARARRPDRPHRRPRLERRRAARRPIRARATRCASSAGSSSSATGSSSTSARSRQQTSTLRASPRPCGGMPPSSRDSWSSSSPSSRIPGSGRRCVPCSPTATSTPSRPPSTTTTPTRAGCSSTRSASRRSSARRASSIRACEASSCWRRRSSTMSGVRSSSHAGRRSPRPRRAGCSATSTSG